MKHRVKVLKNVTGGTFKVSALTHVFKLGCAITFASEAKFEIEAKRSEKREVKFYSDIVKHM